MTDATLIYGALGIPLLGLALILLTGRWPALRDTVLVATSIAMFAAVSQLAPAVFDGARPSVRLLELFPGLELSFTVEPLGMLFALVASGLWMVTAVYAIGYMRGNKEAHQTRFHALFCLALSCATGIAFAGNMLTLFVFYEMLTLSTYPLVAHKGNSDARKGARTYLGLLLSTSIGFLLLAVLSTWWLAGSLEFTPGGVMAGQVSTTIGSVLLVLYMYGIGKAALMPFHRWLPAAMVAPTPVSALLHAVAVVKAGVFTVMKVIVYLFGLDYVTTLATSSVMLYVAVFTLLSASVVALRQDNLKARLAYSTVSQLSYIVVGALLATQLSIIGGGMHIAMHAFGKITLFFCAGAIYVASKKTDISTMNGLGRRMPLTFFAFLLGALSVIGLPPFGGIWSKWHLVAGAFDAGYGLVVIALLISTLLNIAYLLPPVVRAFLYPPDDDVPAGIKEAPWLCLLPLTLTALGCVALFFAAQPLFDLLQGLFKAG